MSWFWGLMRTVMANGYLQHCCILPHNNVNTSLSSFKSLIVTMGIFSYIASDNKNLRKINKMLVILLELLWWTISLNATLRSNKFLQKSLRINFKTVLSQVYTVCSLFCNNSIWESSAFSFLLGNECSWWTATPFCCG